MTALLSPVTGDYLLPAHPESMHHQTTEWLSELEFCRTELTFLLKLLDQAFLRVTGQQHIQELKTLEKQVKSFRNKVLKEIHDDIIRHEQQLASFDEDQFSMDEDVISKEHKKHSLGVRAFMGSVRKIKSEIFDVVEKQLKLRKKISKDYEDGTIAL